MRGADRVASLRCIPIVLKNIDVQLVFIYLNMLILLTEYI